MPVLQLGYTTECHWWIFAIRRLGWLGQHFASCQNALHHIAPNPLSPDVSTGAGIGCRRVADAVWLLLIQNGATSAQGLFCAQYWTCTTAALQQTSQSIDFSYLAEAFWILLRSFEIIRWCSFLDNITEARKQHNGTGGGQIGMSSGPAWHALEEMSGLTSRHCRDIVWHCSITVIICYPFRSVPRHDCGLGARRKQAEDSVWGVLLQFLARLRDCGTWWVRKPSHTSHHITSHHITSHHVTSHHIS